VVRKSVEERRKRGKGREDKGLTGLCMLEKNAPERRKKGGTF